ncbi:MAG: transglutaminase-like domain-containing protein, partial [Giesbergeria sp.]
WDEADNGIWRLDEIPVLLVSSFADYAAIARAYGERALPKAEPTDRIRELERSIVGTQADPRERARLLYEWVSTQITYDGSCLGTGAVVPRDTDVVLNTKMGGCTEHATLLQALLTAADVRAEQALTNADELYDLPTLPVVFSVNHVINYLPDFQLYLDATAKQVPFGYLPPTAYAKPVILVGGTNTAATTPTGSVDQTDQRVHTVLKLAANGGASGRMRVEFLGNQAAAMREYIRDLHGDAQRDFVRKVLASTGYKGKGVLDKGDVSADKAPSAKYSFGLSFDIDNYLQGESKGSFILAPVVRLPLSVVRFTALDGATTPRRRVRCYGYHSQETYDITLEPGVVFKRLPENVETHNPSINYSGSYLRTSHGVQVKREIRDTTPEGLCTPEYMAQWNANAKPIEQSLRAPIFYQREMPRSEVKASRSHSAKEKTKTKSKPKTKSHATKKKK